MGQGRASCLVSRVEWDGRSQVQVWAGGCLAHPLSGARSDCGQRPQVARLHLYPESLRGKAETLFFGTQKTFRVIGCLEVPCQDCLQGSVFRSRLLGGPGLVPSCAADPAVCSLIQPVNTWSLWLWHKCQYLDWPLGKPVRGAVSGPSGKEAHLQDDIPCSPVPGSGLSCP